ncbi:MAG TPA: SRPBCC family protein [Bacteroidia bacterium]|nr:SRPBCC family protein [Bacteroidia bacterium]
MVHRIETEQYLHQDRRTVWAFVSNPNNLARITPQDMGFEITRGGDQALHAGQIIEYRIRPVLNIPVNWVTEITHMKEAEFFVDEQRFGPYLFWHHRHWLTDAGAGTLMKDQVTYKIGFGPVGRLANRIFIRRRLSEIFEYRRKTLEQLFGPERKFRPEPIKSIS